MGKLETEKKNICPLFGNIRNGNTKNIKIRENGYTEKLAFNSTLSSHITSLGIWVLNFIYRHFASHVNAQS